MTRAIFKAGFVWKVIDAKWAGFEAAFWSFDVDRCRGMSPDDEDALWAPTTVAVRMSLGEPAHQRVQLG